MQADIGLLDTKSLADLMIEHGVGVRTSQTIDLKRLGEDFFTEEVSLSRAGLDR